MEYYNGVRLSPFAQSHWTDNMSQREIIDALIGKGSAYKYLEMLSYESFQGYHFIPVDRKVFVERSEEMDLYLKYDIGATLLIMINLEKEDNVIPYSPKEVGSLIRMGEGLIAVDVLLKEVQKMNLNNAQIHELERLLNKVNRSLNIKLPDVRLPSDEEKYEAIKHLTMADLKKHPRKYYNTFLEDMLIAGTPANMTIKQFNEFAGKVLTP